MDDERQQELERKRGEEGLTHDEANELGRLMAEEQGKPYSNADKRESPDEVPEAWQVEEQAKEQEESATPEEGEDDSIQAGGPDPQKERALGDERQPVGPAAGGYAPPKGGQEAGAPDTPDR